jgi:hypothetical protein
MAALARALVPVSIVLLHCFIEFTLIAIFSHHADSEEQTAGAKHCEYYRASHVETGANNIKTLARPDRGKKEEPGDDEQSCAEHREDYASNCHGRKSSTGSTPCFLLPILRLMGSASHRGEMNVQLIAKEENQDGAQCRKNEPGWMKSFVPRAQKHVGNGAAEDRSNDADHDCPEESHMDVHY